MQFVNIIRKYIPAIIAIAVLVLIGVLATLRIFEGNYSIQYWCFQEDMIMMC